jgi:hypothetical protein
MQQRLLAVRIVAEIRINAGVEDVVLALVVRIGTTSGDGVILFGDGSLWKRHAVVLEVDEVRGRDMLPIGTNIIGISIAIVTQVKDMVSAIREEGDAVSDDAGLGFVEQVHGC